MLSSLPARATVVAVVPARDGVAIAADSRFTFLGASCDGAFKIVEPRQPLRAVAFVTGDSIFVAPPPAGQDPCRYLATAPRLLDIDAVVRAYLDRSGDDPARISLFDLASACVEAVERFGRAHPKALGAYAGKDVFSVVVVSYDPARQATTLRNFVVRIDRRSGHARATRMSDTTVGERTPRGVWIYGEAGYVNWQVYAGPGRRFLSASTLAFLRVHQPMATVPMELAAKTALAVVTAAIRSAEAVPPPSGIGGAIRVVVLDNAPHPQAVLH